MIRNFFRMIRIQGVFNLILVIALLLIGVALLNVVAFTDTIYDLVDISLERDNYLLAEWHFLEIQHLARQYVVFEDHEAILADYEEEQAALDEIMADLGSRPADSPLVVADALDRLAELRQINTENFEAMAEMADAGTITPEDVDAFALDETQINQDMAALLAESQAGMTAAIRRIADERWTGILAGVIVLSGFPLLALWGFQAASRFTVPLLAMSGAVTAIGGGRFRPEMLDDIRRRPAMREAYQTMTGLAEAVGERRARLQADVDGLQAQLNEARRDKLELVDRIAE